MKLFLWQIFAIFSHCNTTEGLYVDRKGPELSLFTSLYFHFWVVMWSVKTMGNWQPCGLLLWSVFERRFALLGSAESPTYDIVDNCFAANNQLVTLCKKSNRFLHSETRSVLGGFHTLNIWLQIFHNKSHLTRLLLIWKGCIEFEL